MIFIYMYFYFIFRVIFQNCAFGCTCNYFPLFTRHILRLWPSETSYFVKFSTNTMFVNEDIEHTHREDSKKSYSTRAFIQRVLQHCSQQTKVVCYTTLVKPLLECACPVWDPFTNLVKHTETTKCAQKINPVCI